MDAPAPDHPAIAPIDTALTTLAYIAAQHAHLEAPRRFTAPAQFADHTADELEDATRSVVADLRDLADTTGIATELLKMFMSDLECRVYDYLEHAKDTITTQKDIADADRRRVVLPQRHPLRRSGLDAIEGVSRTAGDIAALIAYPPCAALLTVLDTLEHAFTSDATADRIAQCIGEYRDTLPSGVSLGDAFHHLIGALHAWSRMTYQSPASERFAAQGAIIGARSDVVRWYRRVLSNPSLHRWPYTGPTAK